MSDRERIVERIKKLLAHANDNGERMSEAEVESYVRMAQKLMREHEVEEDEVLRREPHRHQAAYESIVQVDAYFRDSTMPAYAEHLMLVCEVVCGVKSLKRRQWTATPRGGAWRKTLVFYGLPRDCEVAVALYRELLTSMRVMARVRFGQKHGAMHRSYCSGFVARLDEKARDLRSEPVTGTAIVLVKDGLLRRYGEALGLKAAPKNRQQIDDAAYWRGHADAADVSLGDEDRQIPVTRKELPL